MARLNTTVPSLRNKTNVQEPHPSPAGPERPLALGQASPERDRLADARPAQESLGHERLAGQCLS